MVQIAYNETGYGAVPLSNQCLLSHQRQVPIGKSMLTYRMKHGRN